MRPDSLDPAKTAGKIVVCDRGTYDRVAKSAEVKRAGGIGMVLANPTEDSLDGDLHSVPTVHVNPPASDANQDLRGQRRCHRHLDRGQPDDQPGAVPADRRVLLPRPVARHRW